MNASTIPQLLRNAAAQFGEKLALRQPSGKEVHTWTWSQYLEAAEEIAAGLSALGLGKGDHIALCSETRAEFYLADQGILINGSVAAALYPSYPPEELKRTIAMADTKALFVEDPKMFGRLKDAPVAHFYSVDRGGRRGLCHSKDFGNSAAIPADRIRTSFRKTTQHSLPDLRGHRRAEDGDGHPWGHRREHPHGA